MFKSIETDPTNYTCKKWKDKLNVLVMFNKIYVQN